MADIPIYIMGKRYDVPEGYTIMRAIEFSGYLLTRGCGCRGGACGACATVYRVGDDYRLKVGLACQTPIEPEMVVMQIPFFPARKAIYDVEKLKDPVQDFRALYPEVSKCLGCNACTKACPQGLSVMKYMAAAVAGDLETVAELSFECLMCGICTMRCPAELSQYNVALLARRIVGRTQFGMGNNVKNRISEIKSGKYTTEINRLKSLGPDELKKLYNQRDIVSKAVQT